MDISVIIPTRDSVEDTDATVSCLLADSQFLKSNYEIFIINDGASSEIKKYVDEQSDKGVVIHCINIKVSKGAYFARNRAIEKASGKIIAFFDASMKLPPYWFEKLEPMLTSCDYIAGNVDVTKLDYMSIGQKFDYVKGFPIESYLHKGHFGVTAYLFVRKEIFQKIGLFDESHSGGDGEFGKRVFQNGYKQCFYDKATAYHPPRTFKQQYYKKIRVYKGVLEMHQKYPDKYPTSPITIKAIFNCLTAIPANIVKTKSNPVYTSGIVNFFEYVLGVIGFWGVEIVSRIYVRFNQKKIIGTK